MTYIILKFGLSAAIVVAVSEVSKRSSLFGGLLASLPLTSVLAMAWLYRETHDAARIASLATNIFWLVLPSLILFLLLPFLIRRQWAFYPALAVSMAATLVCYALIFACLRRNG